MALDFGQTEKFFPLGLSTGPARNKRSAVIATVRYAMVRLSHRSLCGDNIDDRQQGEPEGLKYGVFPDPIARLGEALSSLGQQAL